MTTQTFSLVQPVIIPIAGDRYRVDRDYTYEWQHRADAPHQRLNVPERFEYDGASVPAPVRWFMQQDGLHRAAALLHDWIYHYQGEMPYGSHQYMKDGVWTEVTEYVWNRRDADRLFARLMREADVPKTRRRAAYLAVRAMGWWAWRD